MQFFRCILDKWCGGLERDVTISVCGEYPSNSFVVARPADHRELRDQFEALLDYVLSAVSFGSNAYKYRRTCYYEFCGQSQARGEKVKVMKLFCTLVQCNLRWTYVSFGT